MAQPKTGYIFSLVLCDVGLMLVAGISQSAWNHSMNQGGTGVQSEITTDIGAMVNLIKEESDIPCTVCGRIREIHEKRDSVKKENRL